MKFKGGLDSKLKQQKLNKKKTWIVFLKRGHMVCL